MTSEPAHIAIVGCGFTGTSALHQLISRTPVREITVFEASGQFGPGYAYDPEECSDYLINNTTDTMCLGPENKRAFLDWLEKRPVLDVDLDPKGHLPRSVYGLFLRDSVESSRKTALENGVEINLISAEVTQIVEDTSNQVTLSWPLGEVKADAVIMATGRCQNIDLCVAPAANSPAKYFNSHIGSEELDELPMDAEVHILGASLSAYDIVNRLFSDLTGCRFERGDDGELCYVPNGNERVAVLCSRSGRLKKMQSRTPENLSRTFFSYEGLVSLGEPGDVTLNDVATAISDEAAANNCPLESDSITSPYSGCENAEAVNARAGEILERDIQAAKPGGQDNFLVDLFNDAQIDIWDAFADRLLSPKEEFRYRTTVETALLSYAAPCPIPTAERLLALHKSGHLRVIRGVSLPDLSSEGDNYTLRHAHGDEMVRVLINATGKVDRDILSASQPSWIRHLVEDGRLQPYSRADTKFAGADVEMSSFRPPLLIRVHFANMFLWGPGFFTSSAFMMATIVSRIVDHLFPSRSEQY
ncbi:MAG: FAD/NAD(P)-binding protein [Pseudomonadales bacterium]